MNFTQVGTPDKPLLYVAHRANDDPDCMHDWQLAWVEKLAMEASCKRFLEVGVWRGQTTRCLAQFGHVVAVDWFAGSEELYVPGSFTSKMDESRVAWFIRSSEEEGVAERITLLTGKSDDALPLLKNERFGIVIVDANHAEEFAYRDIVNTWKLIVPGGWLLLDDFSTSDDYKGRGPSVRRAWERFAKENGLEGRELFTCDNGQDETHAIYGPKLVGVRKP